MPFLKHLSRSEYIDHLIRTKSTGSPSQLARKLHLSQRATFEILKEMRALGCPIKFSRKRNSYYYSVAGNILVTFFNADGPVSSSAL